METPVKTIMEEKPWEVELSEEKNSGIKIWEVELSETKSTKTTIDGKLCLVEFGKVKLSGMGHFSHTILTVIGWLFHLNSKQLKNNKTT